MALSYLVGTAITGTIRSLQFFLPARYSIDRQAKNLQRQMEHAHQMQSDNHAFLKDMEAARQRYDAEKTAVILYAQAMMQNRLMEHQREMPQESFGHQWQLFEAQKQKETELQRLAHRMAFALEVFRADLARQDTQFKHTLQNFPFTVMPMVTLDKYRRYQEHSGPIPLMVAISPPEVDFERFPMPAGGLPKMESALVEDLLTFLAQHYPNREDSTHPVDFSGGLWRSKETRAEAAMETLHHVLFSVPTFILHSEVDADTLNLHIGAWDVGADKPDYYPVLSGFEYRDFIYRVARAEARSWRTRREQLKTQGITEESIRKLEDEHTGKQRDVAYNIKVLEEEEKMRAVDPDLSLDYRPTALCHKALKQFLGLLHRILAAMAADEYFFLRYQATPRLPTLLPELIADLSADDQREALTLVIGHYQQFCAGVQHSGSLLAADLALDLAESLRALEDKSWAEQQARFALRIWLFMRGQDPAPADSAEWQAVFAAMRPVLGLQDMGFVEKLKDLLEALGEQAAVSVIYHLLAGVFDALKAQLKPMEESVLLIPTKEGLQPGDSFRDKPQGGVEGPELIVVGPGSFQMGGTYDDEKPIHTVNIAYPFAIGKYQVTFEEYDIFCEAAGKQKPEDEGWGRGKHPVINIYWSEAVEYCAWLSGQTGETYRLPSEAEWEYACRAGSDKAYCFGDNSAQLAEYAWYDGNAGGKTHPVGGKKANAWGLFDVHGNVWEWCQDNKTSYSQTPTDGSAYENGDNARILRGGSWCRDKERCRAAYRNDYSNRYHHFGFRVVRVLASRT